MSADDVCRNVTCGDWNVYRTRFLVRAKQLTEPLVLTDALGREHRGRPGDYLVQSSEGLLRIAPREIFDDVYVRLCNETGRHGLPAANLLVHSRGESLSA
jgi:hypothetical protein